ncbi:MAG: hypothetical protein K0R05_1135 [Anaerocolumna sp.]|jgi:cyclic lactone autoinducer peptide|nr:hypothetical protein [Anaerocolumna sp.]
MTAVSKLVNLLASMSLNTKSAFFAYEPKRPTKIIKK